MRSKNIHFIYFISETRQDIPFTFIHWAAIRSAKTVNPEYTVHLWCRYVPDDNHYVDDLKPDIEIHIVEPPTTAFDRPLVHLAHRADWMRLNILNQWGGVYMDVDTICVKPFDSLPDVEFGIAEERKRGVVTGLCNCIMLARPQARFIALWMAEYASFRSQGPDGYWSEHSGLVPWRLSQIHPELAHVFASEVFLQPDYTPEGLAQMFLQKHEFPQAVAHHLWQLVSLPLHTQITEANVRDFDVTYTALAGRILGDAIERLRTRRLQRIMAYLDTIAPIDAKVRG